MSPRSTIACPRRVTECVCDGRRMNGGNPTGGSPLPTAGAGAGVGVGAGAEAGSGSTSGNESELVGSAAGSAPESSAGGSTRIDSRICWRRDSISCALEPSELDLLRRLRGYVEAVIGGHTSQSAAAADPGAIARSGEPQFTLSGARSVVARNPGEEENMATAEEVRDALLERIAYHTVSADAHEVLALAKAYSYLVDEPDDDEDEDDEDDDD